MLAQAQPIISLAVSPSCLLEVVRQEKSMTVPRPTHVQALEEGVSESEVPESTKSSDMLREEADVR